MNKQQDDTPTNIYDNDEIQNLENNENTSYSSITTTHQLQSMNRQNVISNGSHLVRAWKDIYWEIGTRSDNSQNELVSLKIEHTRYIQYENDEYETQFLFATIFYHKVDNDWAITKSWIDYNSPNYIEQHHTELMIGRDFSHAPRWIVNPPLEFFRLAVGNVTYGPDVNHPIWESWGEFGIPFSWDQGNDPLRIQQPETYLVDQYDDYDNHDDYDDNHDDYDSFEVLPLDSDNNKND